MVKIDRILVPTDFSDNSRRALTYAVGLAKVHGAEIAMLHVVEAPVYAMGGTVPGFTLPNFEVEIREFAEKSLRELDAEVVAGAVASQCLLREGSPFVEIVRAAKEISADLIVISTHGRSGLPHLLLGSTAEKVVRKAPCPVLTFREGMPAFEMP